MTSRPLLLLASVLVLACAPPDDADAGLRDAAARDADMYDATNVDTGVAAGPECPIPAGAHPTVGVGHAPGYRCERVGGPLHAPRDVTLGASGQVYVTENGGGRIVRLDGARFETIADGLDGPIGLREEEDGSLLVAEEAAHTLARIDVNTGAPRRHQPRG